METVAPLALGVVLSAACGLRVFVPPLVLSAAAVLGGADLPARLAGLETPSALVALAVAVLVEVAAFHLPLLDNALDVLAAPLVVGAGTLLTRAFSPELEPLTGWLLASALGGGAAAGLQLGTSSLRLASTATTAGFGNPLVATSETLGALLVSVLALVWPLLALLLVVGLVVALLLLVRRARG